MEGGEIVAPIKDLRFDVSLYDAFGDNLVDLGQQANIELAAKNTYYLRDVAGCRVPGALIDDFAFTL